MFIPITPIQMAALAGSLHLRNKLAIEQNEILKKIEAQNAETLERIEAQNRRISEAKSKPGASQQVDSWRPIQTTVKSETRSENQPALGHISPFTPSIDYGLVPACP